ncbi:MAG: hypothetical protein EBX50_19725, partial [Chitinophagia bacterium]|nr:hypothetical protein [Chitinophagia bacterium]
YTTDVEVAVETTDPDASYEVSGNTGLVDGENTMTVTVTAADGVTTATYTVTLTVLLSADASLSMFVVNGNDVADGDVVELDPYTTEVEVFAEATDENAVVEVSGGTDLVAGENILTVTVTAANGDIATYTVTLTVLLSSDNSLATFAVDGTDVVDGAVVDLDYGTTEVEVVATATDENATVEIAGGTELVTGENTLTVSVTAPNGDVAEYSVTLKVAPNSDASLSVFSVNGVDVESGDVLDFEFGTTEVEVVAEATDADATVEISGNADLVSGENTLVVTVTAADGETVEEFTVTLNVAFNSDTSLATFQVNGEDVEDGAVVDLAPYTTEVEVVAEATDADATIEIDGGTELVVGENLLIVTVTAADGVSATDYVVTLNVPLGNNVELASFQVNGNDVADGDVVELDPYTAEVEVLVETVDPDASYAVSGNTDLQSGENTLTVTVTAADGEATAEYTVTLTVLLSADTSLATFTVNGNDVADGDVVELDPYTTEVDVVAEATDENAVVEVSGGTDLVAGENTLTVTVTAPNGDVAEYTLTLTVLLSADTSLATFTVNGNDV